MRKLACILLFTACVPASDSVAPCSSDDTCLPGFRCIDRLCVPCTVDQCLGRITAGVGPEGGVVCSAEDVCLHVPAGAIERPLALSVTSTRSKTLDAPGVRPLSPVIEVRPADTKFAKPVRLEFPISSTMAPSRIGVWRKDSAWTRLTGTSTAVTAIGLSDAAGDFAAGLE